MLLQKDGEALGERAIPHQLGAEVDDDLEVQAARAPLPGLTHGFRHDEIGELRHQFLVLGGAQKMARLQKTTTRMLPTHQCLSSLHPYQT